jgi:hypothetical protein
MLDRLLEIDVLISTLLFLIGKIKVVLHVSTGIKATRARRFGRSCEETSILLNAN